MFPTITINSCNFTIFEEIQHYHSTYHLYEDTVLERLKPKDDVLELHFIEMNKFLKAWNEDQLNPLNDLLARWLLLLGIICTGFVNNNTISIFIAIELKLKKQTNADF